MSNVVELRPIRVEVWSGRPETADHFRWLGSLMDHGAETVAADAASEAEAMAAALKGVLKLHPIVDALGPLLNGQFGAMGQSGSAVGKSWGPTRDCARRIP